jgi:prolycopene isomerase
VQPGANRSIPEHNDVVVIGAGLGGLTCALELARQGLKICVLEQQRGAGGYAHAFRREGYHFDVSLQNIGSLEPGKSLHAVLDSLGVFEKLRPVRCETLLHADYPGMSVTLPNRQRELIDELERLFPGSRKAVLDLFAHLEELKHHISGPLIDPDFHVPLADQLTTLHRNDTFQQVVEQYVGEPRLKAVLGQVWPFVGLPPTLATATYFTQVFASSFIEGTHHIVGGGRALVRAMVDRLRELGGECVTLAPVRRIAIDRGSVTGVVLEHGQEIAASIIVSNADPYQTFFELIPGDEPSKLYRFRLENMECSLSAYATYIGLDCEPSALGIPRDKYFFNHGWDHEEAFRRVMAHEIEQTDWVATSSEGFDSATHPEGAGVVVIVELTPAADWLDLDADAYRARKEVVGDRLLAKYGARFEGLADHSAVRELATPRTMARFTRTHRGAVFGLAQTVGQSGSRRLRNRTPIGGLFLTGAWTWGGGGYEGAILSGVQTAASVLRDLDVSRRVPPIRRRSTEPPRAPRTESAPALPVEPSETGLQARAVSWGDPHYRFRFPVTIYGDDMNSRGFVDASAYLRFIDRGRTEAIEAICRDTGEASWLAAYVVQVYRIDSNCATTARLGDRLEIRTGLRKTSSHRAAFDQQIVRLATGEVVVDAVVEVLFLGSNRTLVPVPESFPGGPVELQGPSHNRREPVEFGDDSHFPFRARFRVYYEDTDCQGITYHVSYARFCQRALFELTRALWPEMSMRAWMQRNRINVARLDIRYLKSTRLGDRLEVRTGARQLSSHTLAFDQRIVLVDDGTVVADAITDVECRDENERPAPIPQLIVDAYFEALPPGHVERRERE